jgi:hypothetical protein
MIQKISFQIATVFRENGYIHRTISSLEETGFFDDQNRLPLNLVVGSEDDAYLHPYKNDAAKFKIHVMSEEDADRFGLSKLGPMERAGLTHSLCLADKHTNQEASLLVVLEDDVRFAQGWIKRLHEAVISVSSTYGSNWVMCLYTALTDESAVAARQGKKWFPRKYDWFFGTQGTTYPREIGRAFASEIMLKAVNPFLKPYDLLLSEFLRSREVPIVATAPCLVQHMGNVSQGVCGHFHQSKGFMESIPDGDLP